MTDIPLALLSLLELGSLSMLGWLAAGVLPWLITLWSRQQQQETPWAAVELLRDAVRRRSRLIHFQQWLLLALRTAIIVLVALAVAEPAWSPAVISSVGKGPTHHVLVVDLSYSMSCQSEGQTRLARAQQLARQRIASGNSGDAFSIISWAEQGASVVCRLTFDPSLARSAIDSLSILHTGASLPAALRSAQGVIERAKKQAPSLVHHRVTLLSDLGRNTWTDPQLSTESGRALCRSLAEQAELVVYDVGDNQREQVAVTSLRIEPPTVLQDQPVSVLATLRSFDSRSWSNLPIELSIDGTIVAQQQIDLASNGEAQVPFSYRFADAAEHLLQVSVVDPSSEKTDPLSVDNRRWLVVDARPSLRVACISGRAGAADDLVRALAPQSQHTGNRLSAIAGRQVDLVGVGQLLDLDFTSYDALLLCNLATLTPDEVQRLSHYVRGGGGLVLLLGDAVVPEQYNRVFQVDQGDSLLPVRIGALSPAGEYRFDPLEYQHPLVSPFRGQENSGLLTTTISQYFRLQHLTDRPTIETALGFSTEDPAIVVDRSGLGRVAVVAIPGSLASRTEGGSPWSSFAVSPSFLPIVRELVDYVVGSSGLDRLNRLVGEPLVCPLDPEQALGRITAELPDGSHLLLPTPGEQDQGLVLFGETWQSGVYKIHSDEQQLGRFAVNLDTRESNLATIELADLPEGISSTDSASTETLLTSGGSIALAPALLATALVLLLLELVVAWQMGRAWG